MKYTHFLLRVGEIFLKGKNRALFEKKVVTNVKKITGKELKKLRFRLILDYFEGENRLKNVFGLTSYSPAVKVEQNLEEIKKQALELMKGKEGSFRIETKRADKTFSLKSPEINAEVGAFIENNSNLVFDLIHFDHKLNIEINREGAYLFLDTVKCFGGLPVGVSESVVLLIDKEESILAGLLFMKRGCHVFPVSFSEQDISLLQKFSPIKLNLKIVQDLSEIEKYGQEKGIKVMAVGDTFENLNNYSSEMVVMKPLIGYDEKKIKEELERFRF
ncbi:MAG: hypothetical protein KKA62_01275 [Nanoarchaeota archaeon]|nr:hypothetical protein [Nanoarchaeota archaeon]MBU1644670.1 hypothetical protein [Nanoarchaeota archaeon]MBU1976565.1 hypothetical protein [Nanoarchaeota archaeon]